MTACGNVKYSIKATRLRADLGSSDEKEMNEAESLDGTCRRTTRLVVLAHGDMVPLHVREQG